MFLCSVSTVFFGDVPRKNVCSGGGPEHAFFPEASPKNAVGTLQRNTIGTLNQCSEPAFRDQLRAGVLRGFLNSQSLSWSRNSGSEHGFSVPIMSLRSVPTVFLGDASGIFGGPGAAAKRSPPEHRVFPEASPQNEVGTLQRNTIGTLNPCSEPVFRDQLMEKFPYVYAYWE